MKSQHTYIRNLIIGLLIILAIMLLGSPKGPDGVPLVLSKNSLLVMLSFCTFNIVLGAGMTFAILAGGIDLSVGRGLALCNVLFVLVLNAAISFTLNAGIGFGLSAAISLTLATITAICAGAVVGLINGVITVLGRIPSFIATLGMYMICWGLAYVFSRGQTITTKSGVTAHAMAPVLVPIAVVAVAHFLLSRFKFGRHVYAVGGNAQAARLSGIPVARVQILAFVICGTCAGIGGILYWVRLATGSSLAGEALELYAIAAVIIGGTSLSGGEGTVIGTFIGALIMGVLRYALVIRQVSEHWQKVVFGAVIIAAVLFDSLRRRRSQ